MDNRKLLIISVLTIFVVAMSLSAVSASKTKSISFKIKSDQKFCEKEKKLKNKDWIGYYYSTISNSDLDRGISVHTRIDSELDYPKHTKLVKATVWFKKKGKIIKKSSSKVYYGGLPGISIKLVKGYKPYKLKVWYKNK